MPRGRTYHHGYHPEVEADVVELILPGNIKAQVSEIPPSQGVGFLIRVWPPNGTHEFGGTNGTALSMSMTFDKDGIMTLKSLNLDHDASTWNPPR